MKLPSLTRLKKEWKEKKPRQKMSIALGMLFLALAVIGVFLPIIPQVPFAIVAAYFFSKGSQRIHEWIRANRFFGQAVKDWEDQRVIRPKLKIVSTLAMIAGAVMGHMKFEPPWPIVFDIAFSMTIVLVLTRSSDPAEARPLHLRTLEN